MGNGTEPESQIKWLSNRLADVEADFNAARSENHRLREIIKAADAVMARRGDDAWLAVAQRCLTVMSRVGKMLSKHAPAADEREAFAEFFSLLAEHGCHPGSREQERLELAFAEWEAKR